MADNVSKNRIYLLLTLLIVISYYHTIHYPFFFDDAPNITGNINLQADTFSEIDFKKNFFQSDGGISLRPLSYLSFALNWVISGKETWSYHLVNILIHIVSVLVLLKTILLLFQTPVGRKISNSDECVVFAAVIATVLWALNPVQTQAVTYIVQRMASLAGMFCIISIFFYLKARIDFSRFSKINVSLFCLSVVFFFAGFFSKENAAILPLLILLIEFIFFGSFKNKKYILFGVAALVFIFLFAEIFSGRDIIQKIVQGYDDRPFNIYERFLTEFRILFFYLTQIFYPIPQRLSLLHSIEISKSLFDPITTFLCILFFVFLLIFAIYKRDKFPFISFAILFYIFAHMIESTIIPLELIFEHRNYLSSMFLFLPFSYYFYKLIDFYRFQKKNKLMEMFLYGFVVCLVIGFGTATYIRNSVWSSQKSL